jgi:8-oxo-dGTP pyrophosphatase MutT (NUDIX family)
MPEKIHLTVATTCVRDGKILMVLEREGGKLVINQPAGHVEPGETFKGAALRETYEETGHMVELEAVMGMSAYPAPNGITYYRVSFLAHCPEQAPAENIDPEIEDIQWMTPEEICAADNHRSHLVQMDVDRYLAGQRYPLEMIKENT